MIEEIIKQAESGNPESQYELGQLYYTGKNIQKNYKSAFEWYRKAAESGHVAAQRMIAEMLLKGSPEINKNRKSAFYWMECAAMQDDITACERLGDMYVKGEGCVKDQNKAIEWYEKAALNNNPIAQCKLGEIFLPIDLKRSKEWFKMAASLNHPWGYSKLCKISLQIEKNVEEAEYWFQKLYSINEISPWIIGHKYLKESVVEKAEEWFEKAIEKDEGNLPHIGHAFRHFGFYEKAFEWYMKSAQKGYKESHYELGLMCENGKGTPVDLEQALFWYQKAVDGGYENLQEAKTAIRRIKRKNKKTIKIITKNEDEVLHRIAVLALSERIPVVIFTNLSIDYIINKLKLHLPITFENKSENCLFGGEEYESTDEIIERLLKSTLRINASLIDYKLSEEYMKKENIRFIFIDSLPTSIDKKDVAEWGREIGANICFTEFHVDL